MIDKDWLNFYTPANIAAEIVNLIPQNYTPEMVVDICVGSGNFLSAASNRWQGCSTLGVDISPNLKAIDISDEIYKMDALNLKDLETINFKLNKLVLANPPFGKLDYSTKNVYYSEKLAELQIEAIKTKRIEALMLVSNLHILNDMDLFGAILPQNIFEAENLKRFKEMFLAHFDVLYIGTPGKYFSKSEVKTRIFVGKFIKEVNYKENVKIEKSIEIECRVLRGIDNSKLAKNVNINNGEFDEVVHFSNNDGKISQKRYVKKNTFSNDLKIDKYDVLVSRVGRNSGKIHYALKAYLKKYPSDYFYLLKDFKKMATEKQLQNMENCLLEKKRGLTTKYLCKKDITEQIQKITNNFSIV
ncbi:N-6 DNA Methylase [Flavobacterium aquidurense]|uniref:Site-specific DNA-methyltransferase (adenine-specific) n=1 Tax=Flavobacterium frigidimaris TaxID=262320 RepID=A0ABX4BQS3_FLAFR|nr:class I SAM-dependent methyltransferase [Flavobacterium frigidimaris]OXA78909.1 hypothetical protein B0A65_12020 [Flavobacterium frigidimaris]SDZ51461.1 N-6 DNA Methylase [Flavobacterium aquidurense]